MTLHFCRLSHVCERDSVCVCVYNSRPIWPFRRWPSSGEKLTKKVVINQTEEAGEITAKIAGYTYCALYAYCKASSNWYETENTRRCPKVSIFKIQGTSVSLRVQNCRKPAEHWLIEWLIDWWIFLMRCSHEFFSIMLCCQFWIPLENLAGSLHSLIATC